MRTIRKRARREEQKRDRRRAILAAARRLFWERGFQGTTMPEIAAALKLSPGTLYLYFPGKDALYAELLVEGFERLAQALEDALDTRRSARGQLEDLVEAFFEFARKQPQYFEILFFVRPRALGAGRLLASTLQRDRLAEREQRCKGIVSRVLARAGQRPARIPATVDALWSMLAGLVSFFDPADRTTFAPIGAAARRVLLEGIDG
jgi:AcrR family transcriptional regulator